MASLAVPAEKFIVSAQCVTEQAAAFVVVVAHDIGFIKKLHRYIEPGSEREIILRKTNNRSHVLFLGRFHLHQMQQL